MNQLKSMDGMRFGRLLVLYRAESNSKSGNAMWVCRCDCGNIVTVIGSKLRSGHTKSCGCLKISDTAQGHSQERIYRTWKGMHNRCYNATHDTYKWYGGKGITICAEWHDFIVFRKWALETGYSDDLTIDRVDPTKNYCPDNCRWVSMKFQANNRTNNHIVFYEGREYSLAQLAEKLNIPCYTMKNQMRLGWDIKKIVQKAKGII